MEETKNGTQIQARDQYSLCSEAYGSIRVEYYLCWHMCALIWFQDHIRRAGDFQKYSLHMDDEEFDYHLEFARIQKIFTSVIIKEVIPDTGHFYFG
jgi:hypothetical protein